MFGWTILVCSQFVPIVCAAPVHPWQTVEITLHAANAYTDPYSGTQVWVDLEGPGFSNRCRAFWDGGNTFRVRVMAIAPGTWTWRGASQFDDPGLTGQSGAFEAVPWTGDAPRANPNRRGRVRIAASGRYFEYAIGLHGSTGQEIDERIARQEHATKQP